MEVQLILLSLTRFFMAFSMLLMAANAGTPYYGHAVIILRPDASIAMLRDSLTLIKVYEHFITDRMGLAA